MSPADFESLKEIIANCDQEPIHALGYVQPHGALLCFNQAGVLLSKSRNAETLLGALPASGQMLTSDHLSEAIRETIQSGLADRNMPGDSIECTGADDVRFDVIMHWSVNTLLVEFERIADDAPAATQFAQYSQRAIQRIQMSRYDSVEALLQAATDAIRTMTGFDRVMGYRFLPDGSGEVVAEARHEDLPSYLQQRYPAGDIPEQARRLYVLNPIRQIASVSAPNVAIEPPFHPETGGPYDLSYAVLRSVSPIHIEYLTNMGVCASMSVSIVVNGKLWGLFACHHMTPYRASHAVRLSCMVLTQVVSILITQIEANRRIGAEQRISNLRTAIAAQLAEADDPLAGVLKAQNDISGLVQNEAVWVIVENEVLALSPGVSAGENRDALIALTAAMASERKELLVSASLASDMPAVPAIKTAKGHACGCLAIQMLGDQRITIVWLRDEFVETINWAGPIDKVVANGPHGLRLTPRGSFAVWKQTVHAMSQGWTEVDRFAARELRAVLQDIALNHMREAERARTTLLATLGHDLRDPLQAINLAVQLMGRGLVSSNDTARRVEGSTRRMQSLINYILDVSRIRAGLGLGLSRMDTSLSALLQSIVEETSHTHPGIALNAIFDDDLGTLHADSDRLAQAIGNLIGNARHHGNLAHPVRLEASVVGNDAVIKVINKVTKKVTVPFDRLVDPFKTNSLDKPRNHGGLGLGLFIANAIVKGHGGTLSGKFTDDEAQFIVTIPHSI